MERKLFLVVILTLLAGSVLPIPGVMAAAPLREQLEKGVSATVEVEQQTAEIEQKWQAEARSLADEMHVLELELKLLMIFAEP